MNHGNKQKHPTRGPSKTNKETPRNNATLDHANHTRWEGNTTRYQTTLRIRPKNGKKATRRHRYHIEIKTNTLQGPRQSLFKLLQQKTFFHAAQKQTSPLDSTGPHITNNRRTFQPQDPSIRSSVLISKKRSASSSRPCLTPGESPPPSWPGSPPSPADEPRSCSPPRPQRRPA